MKIACNYYRETEELLDEGKVQLDYVKYPGLGFQLEIMEDLNIFEDFCNRITSKYPILLHGLFPAPHDLSSPLLLEHWDDIIVNKLIYMTKTPGLSFHPALSTLPTDIPFHKLMDIIINNARYLKQKYASMEFVSLENCPDPRFGDLIKPQVIKQLLEASKCEFLLDISHAYCAAKFLDIPFYHYLEQLPLDKTTEIHINGWIERGNDIMCHTKINNAGYEALAFVLGYCKPEIITVEYGRNTDYINAGIPTLSANQTNPQAKDEIAEQIYKINELIQLLAA